MGGKKQKRDEGALHDLACLQLGKPHLLLLLLLRETGNQTIQFLFLPTETSEKVTGSLPVLASFPGIFNFKKSTTKEGNQVPFLYLISLPTSL